MVSMLIQARADINLFKAGPLNPLTVALAQATTPEHKGTTARYVTIALALLRAGAMPPEKISSDVYPLDIAICAGSVELARLLIQKKADVNKPSESNWFPIYRAVYCKELNIARLLLSHGANPNADAPGYPPDGTPLIEAVRGRNVLMARLLLAYGADPNVEARYAITALIIARKNKDKRLVALLKKAGAKESSSPLLIPD